MKRRRGKVTIEMQVLRRDREAALAISRDLVIWRIDENMMMDTATWWAESEHFDLVGEAMIPPEYDAIIHKTDSGDVSVSWSKRKGAHPMTDPQTDAPTLRIDEIKEVGTYQWDRSATGLPDPLDARDAVIADLVEALDYALRAFDHCGTFRRDPLDEVFLMVRKGSSIACMADARAALAKAAALKGNE